MTYSPGEAGSGAAVGRSVFFFFYWHMYTVLLPLLIQQLDICFKFRVVSARDKGCLWLSEPYREVEIFGWEAWV